MTNSVMTPIEVVNQAYDKDFRWWFLALLVCVFIAGIWILKYFVVRAEKTEKSHTDHVGALVGELSASREHHHQRMEALTSQAFKQAEEIARVVASNTAESREVRNYLERLQRNAS
jgi:hypothetical protein